MNEDLKQYFKPGKPNLIIIYILFLSGLVAPLLGVIGVILAFLNYDSPDRTFNTHYTFLLRTFWLGIAGLAITICLSFLILITKIFFFSFIFYFVLLIWFIGRIAWGLKYLVEERDFPNPSTFWIR